MGLKEAYLEKRQAQLDEWDAEIRKLEAKAAKAKAGVKVQYYKQLRSLHSQQKTAREKLSELKETSGEAWGSFRDGLEAAWKDLSRGLKAAAAKFK